MKKRHNISFKTITDHNDNFKSGSGRISGTSGPGNSLDLDGSGLTKPFQRSEVDFW